MKICEGKHITELLDSFTSASLTCLVMPQYGTTLRNVMLGSPRISTLPFFCFRVFCSFTCLALFCIALLCMILHNIRLFQMGSHVLVLRRLTWVEHGPGAMACALQPVLGRARVRPTCYSGHIAHLNWHCLQPGESSKTYDRIP